MGKESSPRIMNQQQLLNAMGEGVTRTFDPGLRRSFDVADNEVPRELRDPEKLKFHDDKIKVSGDGVFYTLQGEGVSMGEPATFLRTHICNLACGWCDAYYTWNPKSTEFWTESQDWTFDEAADKVKDSWGASDPRIQRRVVFTGGEPLLQKMQINKIMDRLPDWKVEIETNGTIMPSEQQLLDAQFNVSPKLSNSQNAFRARVRPDVIKRLSSADAMFKFVVMGNNDLDEIERDYIEGCGVNPEHVILMPQGVTAEEVQMNMRNVAEYAKVKGYRLLGRLQNDIWGARRGV